MGLISQNAVVKKNRDKKKSKRKHDDDEVDEPSVMEEGQEEKVLSESEDSGVDEEDVIEKKKRKRKREALEKRDREKDELEMKNLENSVFGAVHSPVEFGKIDDDDDDGSALFVMDRSGSSNLMINDGDDECQVRVGAEDGDTQRKPAWVDDEEEKTAVNIAKVNRLRKLRTEEDETVISGSAYVSRLRAQHEKLNPSTNWANLDFKANEYSSDEESELDNGQRVSENVDDILRTDEDLVLKRGARLLPGVLEYSKLVDANAEDPSGCVVRSVQFHRNHQLLLTGGEDKKLRFFQIDGKRNKMMDVIYFEDCPIKKASFLPDGSQVIIAGQRKFFYSLDIVTGTYVKVTQLTGREEKSLQSFEVSPDSSTIAFMGNEGYILLVSAKTKQLIGTLKMNGTVRSLAFTHDGQQLLSSGGDGEVYHWDLRTRTCLHKGVDEGSINGSALCTAPVGNLFAAGSSSGIVNVYNRDDFLGGKRKPLKTIENLTSSVGFMKFNHDAQILAICSSMKKSSIKLVHIPSFTVFSNWPPPNRSLKNPSCVDFSPAGGFMAVGNAAGKVLLYKLHHYQQA